MYNISNAIFNSKNNNIKYDDKESRYKFFILGMRSQGLKAFLIKIISKFTLEYQLWKRKETHSHIHSNE